MNEPTSKGETAFTEAETLRLVVEGTASETGSEFFRALVKNLAKALGTAGAWVTEYFPEQRRLRALAMWMNGQFIDHFEYDVLGTACERVVESRQLIHIPDRLIELFPRDSDLVPLHAVSYLGAPLQDTDGTVIGHLSVLDTRPMPRNPWAISLFEIFAARAAAEHRRLQAVQGVHTREEQLSALLDSAMDAILVLDSDLRMVRVNLAASRLFGCTTGEMVGEPIQRRLVPDSASRLETFARELQTRPEGRQQLWVPHDFVARRQDQSVFPAEATLSRFENRCQGFYTLILRNVDERLEAERQIQLLSQETEFLREAVRDLPGHDELIGDSDSLCRVREAVRQVAPADSTVLITGETGTGKERVARSIHRASRRTAKPFVVVNCAAIPANLIESEFFGHERGAFTGAVSRRQGRFALADGGSIFLDEIGELPLELQPKLLRVLQEGEFEPLGSTRSVRVDVRVIAATHRDLAKWVAEERFREDLYFRLNVFPIHVPPLRERGSDTEQLASVFLHRFTRRLGKRIDPLTAEQRRLLSHYHWPGNIRELQNVIERAVLLTTGRELQLEQAMTGLARNAPTSPQPSSLLLNSTPERVLTAQEFQELESANLRRALEQCRGRIAGESGAARLLGIPPSTLTSRMKALKIQTPPLKR